MTQLLSRKTYRQVIKNLEHYRKQHIEDRAENPNQLPPSWGSSLKQMIENTVRQNHERCHKGLADEVLVYLASKGLLVEYAGDYTFPTNETLPTKEQIKEHTIKTLKSLS